MGWVFFIGALAVVAFFRVVVRSSPTTEDATAPFLPFRQRCHCGREPSPTGVATCAIVLGISPPEFKARFGSLCVEHVNSPREVRSAMTRLTEAEFHRAHAKGMEYLENALVVRRDDVVSFQKRDARGITETHYSSGRVVEHDPPLPE